MSLTLHQSLFILPILGLICFPLFLRLYRHGLIRKKTLKIKQSLRRIAKREPRWSEKALLEMVQRQFYLIQEARAQKKLELLKDLLHPELYKLWERKINQFKHKDEIVSSSFHVNACAIVDLQNFVDDHKDNFTVFINANRREYVTVDGKLTREVNDQLNQFLTFIWHQDRWVLQRTINFKWWQKLISRRIFDEAAMAESKKAS